MQPYNLNKSNPSAERKIKFFIFAYWHDPRWKKFIGASVKIWDLATNLNSLGHKVTLFLPKYKFDTSDLAFKVIEIPFIDLPILRNLSFNFILLSILVTKFVFNVPDIVYVRRMASVVPLIYAKIFSKAFFYEVNDDPYNLLYNKGSKFKFKAKAFLSTKNDEINLKLCDRAFIISKSLLNKIKIKNPTIKAKKLVVTPSGTNTQLFYPRKKLECKSYLKLNFKKKYIGFVGTLLKHQGVDKLIQAAPIVLRKEPECRFVIIGEGPMKEKLIKMVQNNALGNFFLFTGQVKYEDVAIWIGAMDICVAPFLKEAGLRSPVKLFDYMACSRPVVASKINGSTDIFANSNIIKLIAPEDAEILANALIELLVDEKKAHKIGKRGRKFVIAQYDRYMIANKISNIAKQELKN